MNIVMRYIHRNKNKMKRSVLAFIIITIAVAACAFIGSYGAVKVLAAQTDTDAAVPAGVVEEKKLTINKKTYVLQFHRWNVQTQLCRGKELFYRIRRRL